MSPSSACWHQPAAAARQILTTNGSRWAQRSLDVGARALYRVTPPHRTMASSEPRRALTLANINPHVKEAQYAVRGELAVRSEEYRATLAKGEGKDLPFDTVIAANIGNPQQLDQKPITFFRQVASLLENPLLLEHEEIFVKSLGYKSDVFERARRLLKEIKSVGAYSQSQGAPGIRESVAKYIERAYWVLELETIR
ncbi:hypothetical protein PMIN07_004380 [Paraphaeosphaeria minitans]